MDNEVLNNEVVDRKSFIIFLEKFYEGYLENKDKEEWENPTLERFLEAMTRYAKDVQGYYNNFHLNIDADVPSWRVFADILTGAKGYE